MKLDSATITAVVVASAHNPVILHHSFLLQQGVVEPGREPLTEGVFTSAAMSRVAYADGLQFVAQGERFQVQETEVTEAGFAASRAAHYALLYVRALPHVPYRAVGFNFTALVMHADPKAYLRNRFLCPGVDRFFDQPPEAGEVKLVYPRSDGIFQLSVSLGGRLRDGEPDESIGVVVEMNYHHNVDTTRATDDVCDYLATYPQVAEEFRTSLTRLFEPDEQ